jgi:hypothetical protein
MIPFVKVSRPDSIGAAEHRDCTVRALANATGMAYEQARALAAKHGRRTRRGMMMGPLKALYKEVLGNDYIPVASITLQQWTRTVQTTGTYIVRTRGHVFAVRNGTQYDMNPNGARKRVLGFWVVG